jgi:hypothetical protein
MNKPTLRQLRKSYRAHAGPRAFGPVDGQSSEHEALRHEASVEHVRAESAAHEFIREYMGEWVPAREVEPACPHCSYQGNGDNHCPSCPTRKAQQVALSALPSLDAMAASAKPARTFAWEREQQGDFVRFVVKLLDEREAASKPENQRVSAADKLPELHGAEPRA